MPDYSNVPLAYRFVGGRRRYNMRRRLHAALRRHEVMKLIGAGWKQKAMALRLGVHESTISRDKDAIYSLSRKERTCPHCGKQWWKDLLW